MAVKAVYRTVVQHQDAVGVLHAGNALGDDDACGAWDGAGEVCADARVRGGIHGAGGIVENQYLRPFEQRPGDAQPLPLPAGKVAAAALNAAFVALRQTRYKIVRAGQAAGFPALRAGGILASPAQVFQHRTRKEHVVLRHHGYLHAQCLHIVGAHIHAADAHAARIHIVQAANQVGERGFTAARAADNADGFARTNVNVYIAQRFPTAALFVGKMHVVKVDAAVGHRRARLLGVSEGGRFLQHLCHTPATGGAHGNHDKDH